MPSCGDMKLYLYGTYLYIEIYGSMSVTYDATIKTRFLYLVAASEPHCQNALILLHAKREINARFGFFLA